MPNNAGSDALLVVGPSWVGDMVMAQSLFISLRRDNPARPVDVVAPAWSAALVRRMPEVRTVYTLDAGHGELRLGERWRLGRRLRANHYRRAIVLPRSFKSALVPWFAGIARRTGFRSELRYGVLNDLRPLRNDLDQTVKRFVFLGGGDITDCPPPALSVDRQNTAALQSKLGLDSQYPVVGLMPGAEYGPAKQWPPRYFAELTRCCVERGFGVWIFGSAKDAAVGKQIIELSGCREVVNLCGKTGLTDAVDLIAGLDVAVSNDSGLMHVAAAVGVHLVAIFGSSSPAYTPPLSDRARVLYRGVECSPCFQRHCPYGHYRCLTEIGVSEVWSLVESRVNERRDRSAR